MTLAQWPGHFCRKMSCLNGSRKLHFVQKIHPDPKVIPKKDEKTKSTKKVGQAIIFCEAHFLLTIEVSTFSGQVSAIGAGDAAIFTELKNTFSLKNNS